MGVGLWQNCLINLFAINCINARLVDCDIEIEIEVSVEVCRETILLQIGVCERLRYKDGVDNFLCLEGIAGENSLEVGV